MAHSLFTNNQAWKSPRDRRPGSAGIPLNLCQAIDLRSETGPRRGGATTAPLSEHTVFIVQNNPRNRTMKQNSSNTIIRNVRNRLGMKKTALILETVHPGCSRSERQRTSRDSRSNSSPLLHKRAIPDSLAAGNASKYTFM